MGARRPDIDSNLQVGILMGCEWSLTDIAQHLGVSVAAISQRKKRKESRALIEKVAGYTRVGISRYVQARIRAREDEIEEMKQKIRDKGYKIIDKKLDAGLDEKMIDPDATHLKAAEMAIERTEGKPLDRKAILELKEEHIYTHEVDGGDLDNILRGAAEITELRRAALPLLPAFKDAEEV